MTFAPQRLRDLAAYWVAHGGVNLGIVGDTAHLAKGVSYHLGSDDLLLTAYSIRTARDRAGLSLAASAIDLGRLDGSLEKMWAFSRSFAQRCFDAAPGYNDVREIIFWSTTRQRVIGWSDLAPGQWINDYGDLSHKTHTHISFYRDSESRGKVAMFAPFFPALPEADMGPFTIPEIAQTATLKVDPARPGNSVWIYTTDALVKDGREVSLGPVRPLRHIGWTPAGVVILAYEPAAGDLDLTSRAMYVAATGVASFAPIAGPLVDCTAATDPLKAQIALLQTDVVNAKVAGARAEWDRQAAGATVAVKLLPKP